MPRTVQKDGFPGIEHSGLERPVGLVADRDARERIGAILEEGGLEFEWYEGTDQIGPQATPSPLVICAGESLAQAVARHGELLGEAVEAPPVVIVCDEIRPGEIRLALAAGASGVVLERQAAATLAACVGAVGAGQVCVPRPEARQVEPARLSPREKQILGLVVMGFMNGQIAEQLFVAESTVKSHLSSIFAKLGVRSRSEAVELILDPERGIGIGVLALGGEPIEAPTDT